MHLDLVLYLLNEHKNITPSGFHALPKDVSLSIAVSKIKLFSRFKVAFRKVYIYVLVFRKVF